MLKVQFNIYILILIQFEIYFMQSQNQSQKFCKKSDIFSKQRSFLSDSRIGSQNDQYNLEDAKNFNSSDQEITQKPSQHKSIKLKPTQRTKDILHQNLCHPKRIQSRENPRKNSLDPKLTQNNYPKVSKRSICSNDLIAQLLDEIFHKAYQEEKTLKQKFKQLQKNHQQNSLDSFKNYKDKHPKLKYGLICQKTRSYYRQHSIKLSPKGWHLNHSNLKLNFLEFLSNKWYAFQIIDISKTLLNQNGWQQIVKKSQLFPHLKIFIVKCNKINTVQKTDIEQFKKLRSIDFGFIKQECSIQQQASLETLRCIAKQSNIKILFYDPMKD